MSCEKSVIMVYCNNCKKKIELSKMNLKTLKLELIDVIYCKHININKQIFYPTWEKIGLSEEEDKEEKCTN